jgi:hypothetical protein
MLFLTVAYVVREHANTKLHTTQARTLQHNTSTGKQRAESQSDTLSQLYVLRAVPFIWMAIFACMYS